MVNDSPEFPTSTAVSSEISDITTTKHIHPTNSPDNTANLAETYKVAAEVAVAAAIIVALAILLALIWNALKKRLPDVNNNSGAPSSSSRRRYSLDSLERLVEDRLRNRPPAYSPDQDKPPSYEDSFNDPTRRHSSPKTTRSDDEHNRRQQRPTNSNETMMQQNPREHQSSARAENDPSLPPYRPRYPSPPRGRHNRPPHRNAVVQSYDNPAFTTDTDETQSTCHEAPINSISMSVDESHVHGDMNNNQDHEMEMVHL